MKTKDGVMLCGSRSVPVGTADLVGSVVEALLAGENVCVVGCATGADELALSALLSAGALERVQVFAAFGPGGAGAWRGSAVATVSRFAAAGGQVTWWAGGSAAAPLSIRLPARTRAAVQAAAGLVAFFSVPDSRGTRLACRLAARCGLPVVAFPLGFRGPLLPGLGAGRWRPCSARGAWAGAWRWVPEQAPLFQEKNVQIP